MSVAKGTRSHTKPIIADAFTVKSQMKNAQVISPKKAGAFVQSPGKPTEFRKFYERGDFPIALEHDTKGNKIAWKVTIPFIHHFTQRLKFAFYRLNIQGLEINWDVFNSNCFFFYTFLNFVLILKLYTKINTNLKVANS